MGKRRGMVLIKNTGLMVFFLMLWRIEQAALITRVIMKRVRDRPAGLKRRRNECVAVISRKQHEPKVRGK